MIYEQYRLISRPFINRWLVADEDGTQYWINPDAVMGLDEANNTVWLDTGELEPFNTYLLPPIDFN